MRIEVDTKHDSREELAALADMLQRLSRSSGSGAVLPKPVSVSRNIFDDPSPGVGMMSMFGDSSPAPTTQTSSQSYAQSPAPQPVADGGIFSLFSSPSTQSTPQPQQYSGYGSSSEPVDPDKKTTARELLDDPRIMPY